MTLASVIEQQLTELLAEADPAWLDAPPQVTEEHAYNEWDTFTHQMYTCESRNWELQRKRQAALLFPKELGAAPPPPSFEEFMRELMNPGFDDGPST